MNANIESLTIIDNSDGKPYNISSNPSLMTAAEVMSLRSSTIQWVTVRKVTPCAHRSRRIPSDF